VNGGDPLTTGRRRASKETSMGWLSDIGKAINRVVINAGKTIEEGAQDAGNAIEKGTHDAGKTIEKGAQDAGNTIEKAGHDAGVAINKANNDFHSQTNRDWDNLNKFMKAGEKAICSFFTAGASDDGRASCSVSGGVGVSSDGQTPKTVSPHSGRSLPSTAMPAHAPKMPFLRPRSTRQKAGKRSLIDQVCH
jgi:hypothetical protein